jgi:RND superfamily putative drug exporter
MERLLARLSEIAARRRWWIVGIWAALFLLALPFAGQLTTKLSNGGFEVPGSQSLSEVHYRDQIGLGAQPFTLLVSAPTREAARGRLGQALTQVRTRYPQIRFEDAGCAPAGARPEQIAGASLCRSKDGRTLTVTGFAAVSQNEALKLAHDLRRSVEVANGTVRTFVIGPGAVYDTFQSVTTDDIDAAEAIGIPLVIVVLVLLFGALVAASLPLALGVVSVIITFALTYFIASSTEISIYAQSMISMIGLGVAVDYSLFILARYREDLAAGVDEHAAVARAMRTSGTAVIFSGLTVIVSLGTIWLVPVRAVQSMAAGAMLVVGVAVLGAATLLPAMLHLLGRRVNRLALPVPWARTSATPGATGFWHTFTARVMARPVVSFVGAAGFLLLLTLPALWMTTANYSTRQLPPDEAVVQGTRLLTERVTGPGQGRSQGLVIVARPSRGSARALAPDMRRLAAQVAREPAVIPDQVTVSPLGNALQIVAPLSIDPESPEATGALIDAARAQTAASPLRAQGDLWVAGVSAFNRDLNDEVGGDLAMVIGAILVLAYLVLLVLLRSVVLPLKAVIMNLLSIGAAYGIIVAIFQWGWLDPITGYHHLGAVNTLTPPLVLAITFGLSMDYEVFLLSRIKEQYERHGDNARAVADGLASSARLITSAAAIMVIVFGAFIFTGVPTIKEIGTGLAVAIAIDATVTRLILVPATMRLLGDWNWWLPGWLDRLLPHMAHEAPPTARPAVERP